MRAVSRSVTRAVPLDTREIEGLGRLLVASGVRGLALLYAPGDGVCYVSNARIACLSYEGRRVYSVTWIGGLAEPEIGRLDTLADCMSLVLSAIVTDRIDTLDVSN